MERVAWILGVVAATLPGWVAAQDRAEPDRTVAERGSATRGVARDATSSPQPGRTGTAPTSATDGGAEGTASPSSPPQNQTASAMIEEAPTSRPWDDGQIDAGRRAWWSAAIPFGAVGLAGTILGLAFSTCQPRSGGGFLRFDLCPSDGEPIGAGFIIGGLTLVIIAVTIGIAWASSEPRKPHPRDGAHRFDARLGIRVDEHGVGVAF